MKFYRVDYHHDTDGSFGYNWHTSMRAARADVRDWKTGDDERLRKPEIDTVEVVPTKAGILHALNAYATHPNNG